MLGQAFGSSGACLLGERKCFGSGVAGSNLRYVLVVVLLLLSLEHLGSGDNLLRVCIVDDGTVLGLENS